MTLEERRAHLRSCRALSGLDEEALTLLAASLNVEYYGAGETICVEGEPANTVMILAAGCVQVRSTSGKNHLLRELRPVSLFGEYGVITDRPRTSTVTTQVDSIVLSMEKDRFMRLLAESSSLCHALLVETIERLLEAEQRFVDGA